MSAATVCRVLRQSAAVRPETAEQVRAAMRELQFVAPPPRARKRKRAQGPDDGIDRRATHSHPIALITVGRPYQFTLSVSAIASFVSALTAAAREVDLDVVLDEMVDPAQFSELVRRKGVDGAVLLVDNSVSRTDEGIEALKRLAREIPVVWAMGGHVGELVIDHIVSDNIGVGHIACNYLKSVGCRQMAFFTTEPTWAVVRSRAFGFISATHDAGISSASYLVTEDRGDAHAFCGNVEVVSSSAKATELIAKRRPKESPQGIFAATDREMASLMPVLVAAGLRPNHDVKLISCDNDPNFRALMNPLPAAIDLNTEAIARQVLRRLRNRTRHRTEPPVLIQVSPQLHVPVK